MHIFCIFAGIACILATLTDSFQTVILPRRAVGKFRITRLFFAVTWWPWARLASRVRNARDRETAFSYYGPMALIVLIGVWAAALVTGFGLIYYGMGSPFRDPVFPHPDLRSDIYVSGTTLFTLGLGDLVPHTDIVRMLAVLESGMGLGFLALVIGYFPVLYGAFSRREVNISLLDARAGSPPTAAELMRRHAFPGGNDALTLLLVEWERWAAELLESHISYPLLCQFRSQHSNQSWLAALTAILDTCSLLIAGVQEHPARQAQLTFAVARHALVDLSQVFGLKPTSAMGDRLPPERFEMLYGQLCQAGIRVCRDEDSMERLKKMRLLYEGYADALSNFLCMPLPPWIAEHPNKDNWLSVAKVRAQTEAVIAAQVNASSGLQPLFVEDEEHHIF
ncbi:potassium channel family protein [Silvibacterium acidisoli]|uniref:potassium channel family protein n=1 Tax=Acidobacteriaceae bacterium ZG23-2 TaxID=2883246 RepID=UPI00406BFA92